MKSKGKVKKIWFNENWKLLMRIYYNQISIFCIGYEWVIIAWISLYLVLISVFSLVKCRQMTISAIVKRMQFSKAITIATSIAWWIVALNITKMNYFIVLFSNKKKQFCQLVFHYDVRKNDPTKGEIWQEPLFGPRTFKNSKITRH